MHANQWELQDLWKIIASGFTTTFYYNKQLVVSMTSGDLNPKSWPEEFKVTHFYVADELEMIFYNWKCSNQKK